MASIEKQPACFLSQRSRIKLAILFGSHATGTARADSDINLALLCAAPLTSAEKLELMESIGAEFRRPVEIIDLHTAGEPLLLKERSGPGPKIYPIPGYIPISLACRSGVSIG